MSPKPSYNYCRICGRVPKTHLDEPNLSPIRFWGPDDGWIIGTLCRWCIEEFGSVQPSPDDYAYDTTNGFCDDDLFDEDIF